MKKKDRILIIHHGSGLGGGLVALLGLIDELKQCSDVAVLCVFKSTAIDYLRARDIKVYTPVSNNFFSKHYRLFIHSEASYSNFLSFLKFSYYFVFMIINMFFLSKNELKRFSGQFDILYLNSLFLVDWLFYSKKFFSKTIVHVREPLANGYMGIRKKMFRILLKKYSDLIICVSEDNKKRVNLNDKSVRVYDPVVFTDRQNNTLLIQNKEFTYFTYLGGSQRIKGFEQLINSLEYLHENIKIYFLGGIEELVENTGSPSYKIRKIFSPYIRNKLQILKTKFENSNRIIFVGKSDNVFNYINNSIAVICPFSRTHACLPILEAYSVGKPVIVSNLEGMTEHYEQAIMEVFENGNSLALAELINKMSLMPQRDTKNISQKAISKYKSIYHSNPKVCDLINDLMKQ